MPLPRLKDLSIAVVGLGKSGIAAARLCAREGARLTLTDSRPESALGPALAELAGLEAKRVLGGHEGAQLERQDLLVVSPGVPQTVPEIVRAKAASVPVWAEVELAFRFIAPTGAPVVAITGTNGKSTTTALTGVLFGNHRTTFTGGNLGTPLTEHVLADTPSSLVVVELSSFQLEGIDLFRANAAAFLNLTPDHLDRYPSVEAYGLAKGRLFARQEPSDIAVANQRDEAALALASASRGRLLTFGFGPPTREGARDPGGEGTRSELWVTLGGEPERYELANRSLRGRHNRENAMAAVLLARAMGVPGPNVQKGLDEFPGLPHRLELVSEKNGIEWVNDSKATNVDSTFVGLSAFPAGKARVVLIMGGRGKGAPYAPLRPLFKDRVKSLLTVGEDAEKVERELSDLVPTVGCGTLKEAVSKAAQLAGEGDVVLLSPACASYDQFRSYTERGEAFRRLVSGL